MLLLRRWGVTSPRYLAAAAKVTPTCSAAAPAPSLLLHHLSRRKSLLLLRRGGSHPPALLLRRSGGGIPPPRLENPTAAATPHKLFFVFIKDAGGHQRPHFLMLGGATRFTSMGRIGLGCILPHIAHICHEPCLHHCSTRFALPSCSLAAGKPVSFSATSSASSGNAATSSFSASTVALVSLRQIRRGTPHFHDAPKGV